MTDLANPADDPTTVEDGTPADTLAGAAERLDGLDGLDDAGWSALDHLARTLHARADLDSTLQAVLHTAVEACAGIDAAGVNLYVRGRFEPQAVLGAAPPRLDAEQKRTGEGPCIDASRDQQIVVVNDTRRHDRLPAFGELAWSLGVGAMLCVPMWIDDTRLGSLSLYAPVPREFDEQFRRVAGLVATHAALAIAASRRADNLAVALQSRDLIGQAKGVLIERYRITGDDAFDLLRTSSNNTQLKVVEVARRLVETGELPLPHN